jgi:hydroxymethylpyrimidine pyrophosphatase-like HAD family hydrolase
LARDGVVGERTLDALVRLRNAGPRLALVTGRRIEDLAFAFMHLEFFASWLATRPARRRSRCRRSSRPAAARPA